MDPELTVGLAAVVHGDDVVVVQAGGEVGFALKAFAEARVCGGCGRQQLQRVETGEARVVDQVDLAHAAGAKQPFDTKARYHFTGLAHRHRLSLRSA